MERKRRVRSDVGKVRKALSDKKTKISASISKPAFFFLKRLAEAQDMHMSEALDKLILTVLYENKSELAFLIRQKKLDLQWLEHKLKVSKIKNEEVS